MKIRLIPVLLSVTLLCTSCAAENTGKVSSHAQLSSSRVLSANKGTEMHSGGIFDANETKSVQSILSKSDSSTDYHKLISHTISVNKFFKDFFSHEYCPMVNYNPVIDMINQEYPIQCLRKIGNHTYSIFQGDDGSLIYVFYMDNGTMAHSIYMKKKLISADFHGISVGSTLNTIEKIDPAASIWASQDGIEKIKFFSFHLLTDGILKFTYTRQSDGSYLVSDKYYNKNFKYSAGSGANQTNFDFAILPQDYIH